MKCNILHSCRAQTIFLEEYTVLSKLNNGGLLHMKIFTPAETEIIPVTTDVLTSSKNNDVIEIEEDLEPKPIQGEQF